MSTTGTSFRRGTSTIMGTLIFVGIMFTAVIPMMLVMRQADTLHEMRKYELGVLERERAMENLCLYVCPQGINSPDVDVKIFNKGEVVVHVIKIWINDIDYPMNVEIPSMDEQLVYTYPLNPSGDTEYDIRAMTDRGNVYTAETGILYYQYGKWVTETLGFNLIFPSRPGRNNRDNNWLNELKITIKQGDDILYDESPMYWAISASEKFFQVDQVGEYQIIIDILCRPGLNNWVTIYTGAHSITWPIGEPVIEIKYAIDGDELIVP